MFLHKLTHFVLKTVREVGIVVIPAVCGGAGMQRSGGARV